MRVGATPAATCVLPVPFSDRATRMSTTPPPPGPRERQHRRIRVSSTDDGPRRKKHSVDRHRHGARLGTGRSPFAPRGWSLARERQCVVHSDVCLPQFDGAISTPTARDLVDVGREKSTAHHAWHNACASEQNGSHPCQSVEQNGSCACQSVEQNGSCACQSVEQNGSCACQSVEQNRSRSSECVACGPNASDPEERHAHRNHESDTRVPRPNRPALLGSERDSQLRCNAVRVAQFDPTGHARRRRRMGERCRRGRQGIGSPRRLEGVRRASRTDVSGRGDGILSNHQRDVGRGARCLRSTRSRGGFLCSRGFRRTRASEVAQKGPLSPRPQCPQRRCCLQQAGSYRRGNRASS